MQYRFATFCIVVALLAVAVRAADTTHEETTVRLAYARVAYAVDINTAWRKVSTNRDIDSAKLISEVAAQGLRFNLEDFKCGNLADVLQAKYADVFEDQNRSVYIETSGATISASEVGGPSTETNTAVANWRNESKHAVPDWTIKEILPYLQQESGFTSPLTRYCTYTVTATLANRNETYRAYFLFAADGAADPGDMGNGSMLLHFIKTPIYPAVLLNGHLSQSVAAVKFLESTQRTESSCVSGEVCCDPTTLRCGLPAADLRMLP